MALYKGLSSFEYGRKKTFVLNDIELVKLDLLNHIFTRKGERVMMHDFGTSIPDLVFEPLDDQTIDLVQEELEFVFEFDPRVELLEFSLTPDFDRSMLTASAKLLYIELNIVDIFDLNIIFEEG